MSDKAVKLIIDRFEGSFAVCELEDGGFQTIPRFSLPNDCKEGDCITQIDNTFSIDKETTKKRAQQISEKLNSLFE